MPFVRFRRRCKVSELIERRSILEYPSFSRRLRR
jgi:hypothetical protein